MEQATLEEKGKVMAKDEFLSSTKGKKRGHLYEKPPSHCSEEVLNRNLEKGFIRYPLARGKPPLEPRMGFEGCEQIAFPAAGEQEARDEVSSSPPPRLGAGKGKKKESSPNFSGSLRGS